LSQIVFIAIVGIIKKTILKSPAFYIIFLWQHRGDGGAELQVRGDRTPFAIKEW